MPLSQNTQTSKGSQNTQMSKGSDSSEKQPGTRSTLGARAWTTMHAFTVMTQTVGQRIADQHVKRHLTRGTPRAFQFKDNALCRAMLIAIPCATLAAGIRLVVEEDENSFSSLGSVDAAWSSFSVLTIFLLVFRTSQSSLRFWEGCTSCHMMKTEWFDSCSALVSFCRGSKAPSKEIQMFQHAVVRMFSMLHGMALTEVEDRQEDTVLDIDNIEAFGFELLDPESFDDKSLRLLMNCPHKVELAYQWIQNLIIENVNNGVLAAPPPLLNRAYQELANGMVAFHEALKISTIPVPLPYVQACDWMLMLHYCLVPFTVPQWVGHPAWSFVFCFIQVFILWALKFTASEIESPFGSDSTDLDRGYLQSSFNSSLRCLLDPSFNEIPRLSERCLSFSKNRFHECTTFRNILVRMETADLELIRGGTGDLATLNGDDTASPLDPSARRAPQGWLAPAHQATTARKDPGSKSASNDHTEFRGFSGARPDAVPRGLDSGPPAVGLGVLPSPPYLQADQEEWQAESALAGRQLAVKSNKLLDLPCEQLIPQPHAFPTNPRARVDEMHSLLLLTTESPAAQCEPPHQEMPVALERERMR